MSSSVHINNKNKDMLIVGKEPTKGLDNTKLTAEAKYPINFTESRKTFLLPLHSIMSFSINNWKKAGLKVTVKCFSVDYNPNNTSDILNIHRHLLKET